MHSRTCNEVAATIHATVAEWVKSGRWCHCSPRALACVHHHFHLAASVVSPCHHATVARSLRAPPPAAPTSGRAGRPTRPPRARRSRGSRRFIFPEPSTYHDRLISMVLLRDTRPPPRRRATSPRTTASPSTARCRVDDADPSAPPTAAPAGWVELTAGLCRATRLQTARRLRGKAFDFTRANNPSPGSRRSAEARATAACRRAESVDHRYHPALPRVLHQRPTAPPSPRRSTSNLSSWPFPCACVCVMQIGQPPCVWSACAPLRRWPLVVHSVI